MTKLVWDKVGERYYQFGVDRGVLYLSDGTGVAWNGLTEVTEKPDRSNTPVYYDGSKISDLQTLGSFSGSIKAITYPDEFTELDGFEHIRPGVFLGDQMPKPFGLSWRTKIGNGLAPEMGYKVHLLYNVTATPDESGYSTVANDPNLVEFSWDVVAVPQEIEGFRPTAHVVIDSRYSDPLMLETLEEMLYGTDTTDPSIPSLSDIVDFIKTWYRVLITDHGDGTWTATATEEEIIEIDSDDPTMFTIHDVEATYLDPDTYTISDTLDVSELPEESP